MTNKNKIKLLLSSLVIALPSVAAIIFKDYVGGGLVGAWHFGWLMPVILVALQIFLHLVTFRENERVEQNEKIVNLTYWMLPVISVYVSSIFIALSLGFENVLGIVLSVMFGAMFIVMGNYMPKAKQNRYFGMKIKWTLANEENWNATHRFSGKVWVVCGIVMLSGAFLPEMWSVILLLVLILPTVAAPIIYSYLLYRKQLSEGVATKEDYSNYPESKTDKKTGALATVVGVLVVGLVCALMFVGSITFTVGDEALEINTTFGGGMTLDYDSIESVEYIPRHMSGYRVSGFASTKLLYGWFKNDELGNYTRYTYADSQATVIVYTYDGIIVLADETTEATWELYEKISSKLGV